MAISILNILSLVVLFYIGIGILFSIWFIIIGASRLDDKVNGSSMGFRIAIIPGVIALWPILLYHIIKKRNGS